MAGGRRREDESVYASIDHYRRYPSPFDGLKNP